MSDDPDGPDAAVFSLRDANPTTRGKPKTDDTESPPTAYNLDAEQSIIGAALAHPDLIDGLRTDLTHASFYSHRHADAWIALTFLHSKGIHVNVITVAAEMCERLGRHDQNITDGLTACVNSAPAREAVHHHVHIVRLHARQRAVTELAGDITILATRPYLTDAAIDAAYEQVRALAEDIAPRVTVTDRALHPVPLTEFLSTPDAPAIYRLDQLWPAGGRVILAAQFKAGKSTLIANLIRSLVDGHPFLGKFTPTPLTGNITLIDDELDTNMLRRWLREQQIENTDQACVLPLRGRVSTFNILDPATRTAWAQRLRDVGTEILIFDCLRPVLDSLGLDENHDVGKFLVPFDELLLEAAIPESTLVHHAGHAAERSRGDSRLRDWPDVEWRIVREAEDADDTTGRRPRAYFSAMGRDVDEPEGLLTYEPTTRWLTLAGGTRKQTEADAAIPDVLTYITANPGRSQREIEAGVVTDYSRDKIRAALKRGIELGKIDTAIGNRGARLHFIASDWSDR